MCFEMNKQFRFIQKSIIAFLLVTLCYTPNCFAETQIVGGLITKDTIWNQSQYNFTSHVLVEEGACLSILPNVTINMNNHFIQIDGTLQVLGTKNEPVKMYAKGVSGIDNHIFFTEKSVPWNLKTQSGCILSYCHLLGTGDLSNFIVSEFTYVNISNCKINAPAYTGILIEGNGLIKNTLINNTINGIRVTNEVDTMSLVNNTIIDNQQCGVTLAGYNGAIIMSDNIITKCGFKYSNGCGLKITGSLNFDHYIFNNTVTKNNHGINVIQSKNVVLNHNDIYSNEKYDLILNENTNDANFSLNWWNTKDLDQIEKKIYDYKNDFRLGEVKIKPILNESYIYSTWKKPEKAVNFSESVIDIEEDLDQEHIDEFSQLDQENNALREHIESLEHEITSLKEKNDELERENEELKQNDKSEAISIPSYPVVSVILGVIFLCFYYRNFEQSFM